MMQEYQRYPLVMKHPSRRAAAVRHTVSMTNGGPELAEAFARHGVVGSGAAGPSPEMYPDVIVRSSNDEAYYVSRGYVPAGGADPVGARTVQVAALPPGFVAQQWPRVVGDAVVGDPDATPDLSREYPKYLAALDALVNSPEEEAKAFAAAAEAKRIEAVTRMMPVTRSEAERFVEQEAASASEVEESAEPEVEEEVEEPPVEEPRPPQFVRKFDPDHKAVVRKARDLGLNASAAWSTEEIRRLIAEAEALSAAD